MLSLAFRNIFRHKGRTSLTLATIIFGVSGLILTGGFIEDIFHNLREATIHSQLGHLQVYREGYLEHGRRDPYSYLMSDTAELTEAIRGLPDVSDVLRRVRFSGLANNGYADLPVLGEGVEPDGEARLGTLMTIIKGRQLTSEDAYGILIGRGVAEAMQVNPGDYITLLANTTDGALNSLEFEVIGIFRTFARDYDNRAIRIPLDAARDLIASEGVHSIVVSLNAAEETDQITGLIRQRFQSSGYEARAWYELADFYSKTVDLYDRQFLVLQSIILFMVLLGVSNSVNMAVYERIGEFGTMMALGERRVDIFALVVSENLLLGLLGASAGVLAGIGVAFLISAIGIEMPPPPNSDMGYIAQIHLVPDVIITAFIVGVVATLLASLLPAYRAVRLPVVDALRENI